MLSKTVLLHVGCEKSHALFLCLKNTWARCAAPFQARCAVCRITKHRMNGVRADRVPPVPFANIRAWPRFRTPHCIYLADVILTRRLPFSRAAAGPHRRVLWDYISSPTRPRCQPCWAETPQKKKLRSQAEGALARAQLRVLCCTSEAGVLLLNCDIYRKRTTRMQISWPISYVCGCHKTDASLTLEVFCFTFFSLACSPCMISFFLSWTA